jgi:hypothetical protein
MNIKERIQNSLDSILKDHPKIKNFLISSIRWYFPENKKKLNKIILYNTLGYLASFLVYSFIINNGNSNYFITASLQYTISNIIPILYTNIESLREAINKIIPYL